MIIENQKVRVRWHNKNMKHFMSLGYPYTKIGEEFFVRVEDLQPNSKSIILVKCDYCGKIIERKYQNHTQQYNPEYGDVCTDCKTEKVIKTNTDKYGFGILFQDEAIREKVKKTNLERYGKEYYSQTKEYSEKVKNTSMKRYGVESYSQTEDCKQRKINTSLLRYGETAYSKTEEWKSKTKKTVFDKYGVEYYLQTEDAKNRRKEYNLLHYGVENYTQTDEYREKTIKTNNIKYGKDYYSQTEECKKRYKETCLKKYGVNSVLQLESTRKRTMESLHACGGIKGSRQQSKVFSMIKEEYNDCFMNYMLGRYSLDCALFIGDIKIDIEYDGKYWHQDIEKDNRRDNVVLGNGYKVLRIKSWKRVPTKEQLIGWIEHLVNDGQDYISVDIDI